MRFSHRPLRRAAVFLTLSLSLLLLAAPRPAAAQAAPAAAGATHKPQPIITGTTKSSADAPETNDELEQYAHAPVVQAFARHLGLSTNAASRYFEDFNSGVLILVILYFVVKYIPTKLRERREAIDRDLEDARKQTADAQARLGRIEARLNSLGTEVDALRQQAAESSHAEEARIKVAMEEERQRIVHAAEQELQAAQGAAERGLKRYASDLAVDRAIERVRLTPEGDQAVIDEFLQSLGNDPALRGKN